MVFLGDVQVAIKTYQASGSAFKNTGPTGFYALGGRMSVLFSHLRLQSENPPEVVTIEQIGVFCKETLTFADEPYASLHPQNSRK